jgi:UDP-2,3-diacylglucosamine pyrophosphatase LpxH
MNHTQMQAIDTLPADPYFRIVRFTYEVIERLIDDPISKSDDQKICIGTFLATFYFDEQVDYDKQTILNNLKNRLWDFKIGDPTVEDIGWSDGCIWSWRMCDFCITHESQKLDSRILTSYMRDFRELLSDNYKQLSITPKYGELVKWLLEITRNTNLAQSESAVQTDPGENSIESLYDKTNLTSKRWSIYTYIKPVESLLEVEIVTCDSGKTRQLVEQSIASDDVNTLLSLLSRTPAPRTEFAFTNCSLSSMPDILSVQDEAVPSETWFVGDIHGDILGLHAAFQTFHDRASRDANLVILGDVIDRGKHDIACLVLILHQIKLYPGRIVWLMGNHDNSLHWNKDKTELRSTVSPCEFLDTLNEGLSKNRALYEDLANRLIDLTDSLPRALFVGRVLATHGGFPHRDLLEHSLEHIESPTFGSEPRLTEADNQLLALFSGGVVNTNVQAFMRTDFVNNRKSAASSKIIDRNRTQNEFGYMDCLLFFANSYRANHPIDCIVRGHDHITNGTSQERYDRSTEIRRGLPTYDGRVLTINNLTYNHSGEYVAPNPRYPVMARLRKGEVFPQPIVLKLEEDLVNWYLGTP